MRFVTIRGPHSLCNQLIELYAIRQTCQRLNRLGRSQFFTGFIGNAYGFLEGFAHGLELDQLAPVPDRLTNTATQQLPVHGLACDIEDIRIQRGRKFARGHAQYVYGCGDISGLIDQGVQFVAAGSGQL